MTFKVGDKVLCVNSEGYTPGYLFEGLVYTVVDEFWQDCAEEEVALQDVNCFTEDFEIVKGPMTDSELQALSDEALYQMFKYLRQNGVNPRVVEKHLEQKDALRLIYEAIAEGYNKERQ